MLIIRRIFLGLFALEIALRTAAAVPSRPATVVEVAGPPGTTVVTVVAPPANAAKLWLRTENLVDPRQASLSVDSGSPIPLSNQNCQPTGLAALLNGIGGPLTVLTFVAPHAAITPGGQNSLKFTINSTPNHSVSAFRVLEINFLDAKGNLLLPGQPPVAPANAPNAYTTAEVASGSNLWSNAALISAWGGAAIQAHCGDCHASDGSDLAYFGYSDNTIKQRSLMHGLTDTQAADVLAFIRSLPTPAYAYPWDPPFQPGTNIDALPANQWSAGAGIDGVATNDSQIFSVLFGADAPSFNFAKTINVRTLPVAMPLPTWNDWLPAVFPIDYYGNDFSNIVRYYKLMRDAPTPTDFRNRLGEFASVWSAFEDTKLNNHYVGTNWQDQIAWFSACRWRNVKIWEIIHKRGWEGQGPLFDPWPQTASRVWPDNGVFHTAPHFTIRSISNNAFRDGTSLSWNYASAQWYWLQLVLNDSQHHRGGASPIDWSYLQLFTEGQMSYQVPAAAQTLVALTKAAESGTGDPQCLHGDDSFLPWRAARTEFLMDREHPLAWKPYALTWRNSLFNAWLGEWANWVYGLGRNYFITNTLEVVDGETANVPAPPQGGRWISEHAALLQWLEANNADRGTVKMMVDLANYVWPAANWNHYAAYTNFTLNSGLPAHVPAATVFELSGPPGATLVIDVHPPSNARSLWFRTENLKDPNQASLRVDNGPAIPINNANVSVTGLGSKLNGIGGPLSILSFSTPTARITPGGVNRLTFTVRGTPLGAVATMRILDINFIDANGNLILPPNDLVAAPLTGFHAGDGLVSTGANLWQNAPLVSTWGGTNISAHCGSCHAFDGSDLAYFACSDAAITTHCSKHGLTPGQGNAVLAYIRSLPTPAYGKPWNPPYQPGSVIDSLPASQWAAGAGVSAVLDDDSETFGAWFGANAPQFNFSSTLNIRTLPVAMPLPTWNDWLPNIYPPDYYGKDFEPVMQSYTNMYGATDPGSFAVSTYDFAAKINIFASGALNHHYASANPTDNLAWFSACRWANVKVWEILHHRGWEGQGVAMFSFLKTSNIAARVFPGATVFQTAPNMSFRSQSNFGWRDGSTSTWWYGSAQWLWLQLVLNDSQHHRWGDTPINWQTMTSFMAAPLGLGIPSTAQVMAAVTKAAESGTGDPDGQFDTFQAFRSCSTERIMMRGHPNAWAPYNVAWRNQLIDAWLTEWNRWVTGLGRQYFINLTGEVSPGDRDNTPAPPEAGPWIGEHAAFLQWLSANGADPSTHAMMLNVAKYLWPGANWARF